MGEALEIVGVVPLKVDRETCVCVCVSAPWQDLEQQFERERLSLEEQKTLLRQQLEALREELTAKLTAANEEVTHRLEVTAAIYQIK